MKCVKRWLKCLLVLCLVAALIPLTVSAATSGTDGHNIKWSLSDDGVLTISGTGPMRDYFYSSDVPWRRYLDSIKSIIITDGVTYIGYRAFYSCNSLTSVTIPDSVTSIGYRAFYSCNSLTSVAIPDSVTSISTGTFAGCQSLTSVTIPDSVTSIGEAAFYRCEALTSVTIPNSVTTIGYRAFYSCNSLTSVAIPDSVTSISNGAFEGCQSLTSVTIPDSLTYINSTAFSYCNNLIEIHVNKNSRRYSIDSRGVLFNKSKTELLWAPGGIRGHYSIPDSVTSIGNGAFERCQSLTSVTISDSVTSIDDYAFYSCTSLTSVTIPDSVTSIGNGAFAGCQSLTSVTIPDSVTFIGRYAFEECQSLTSVAIPDSVTYIGDRAFYSCNSLTSVAIPDSVTSIGYRTFYRCKALTSVTIPAGVTYIGEYAFEGCQSLTSVTIPDSVTSIGYRAFNECKSLTRVTIPDSVTSIGKGAFRDCDNLIEIHANKNNRYYSSDSRGVLFNKSKTEFIQVPGGIQGHYTIPNSITSIGNYTFENCKALTSVTIGNSVASIDDRAFYGCNNFTKFYVNKNNSFYSCDSYGVLFNKSKTDLLQAPDGIQGHYTIPDSVIYIDSCAFDGCKALTSVTIPDSVTTIGDAAFGGAGLTSVNIPDCVTSLGERAFEDCQSLKTVTIGKGVRRLYFQINFDQDVDTGGVMATFYACNGLNGIYVDEDNPKYSSDENGVLYDKEKETVYVVPNVKGGVYDMPSSVRKIHKKAFKYCPNLKTLIIGKGVESIPRYAFSQCKNLTAIYFRGNAPKIQGYAFNNRTLTAYYPVRNNTWTFEAQKQAGGKVTWIPYALGPEVTASNLEASGKVKLTWGKDSGASKYEIYRATSKDGQYQLVHTTTDTSYIDSSSKLGKIYYYYVKAVQKNNLMAEPSAIVECTCEIPATVVTASNVPASGKIKLTWEKHAGAAKYEVYRGTSKSGKFELMKTTTSTSYTDSGARAGECWCYYVVVVGKDGSKSVQSNTVKCTCVLSQPQLTISNSNSGKIKLSWDKVDGAVKYKVYRSASLDGKYERIKTTEKTSYTNSAAKAGERYYYKVIALHEKSAADSAYSEIVCGYRKLAQPEVKASNETLTGQTKLTWKAIDGAKSYKVYRSTSKDGTYQLAKTTTNTAYTHSSGKAGVKYYYKVKAIHANSAFDSAYSEVEVRTCELPQPEVTLSSVASSGKIKVSWNEIEGAKAYKIYRATSEDGDYDRRETITETSWTDTSAKAGRTYYYKIVAVHEKSAANSAYSEIKSRTCDLPRPDVEIALSSSKPKVSWDKVTGAESYKVYRATSKSGTYSLVKTTTSLSYKDTKATAGKTYYYKVVAVHSNSNANSAYSSIVSIKSK